MKTQFRIGQRFNRLTIIELHHIDSKYRRYYKCLCDCGKEKIIQWSLVSSGNTKSCGCWAEGIKVAKNNLDINGVVIQFFDYTISNNENINTKTIVLKSPKHGDQEVVYDEADELLINQYRWYPIKDHNVFYAQAALIRNGKRTTIKMHQLIVGREYKKVIDHINGNGLDNRRKNLRVVTGSQNVMNSRKPISNTSGYRGVHFNKKEKKYRACVAANGKRYSLGLYSNKIEAALAYNKGALKYQGEFARLNYFKLSDGPQEIKNWLTIG